MSHEPSSLWTLLRLHELVWVYAVHDQSEPTVALLHRANHASVMITGDACLTACHVAAHVRIVTRKVLILTAPKDTSLSWSWTSPDESVNVPFAVRSVQELRKVRRASEPAPMGERRSRSASASR